MKQLCVYNSIMSFKMSKNFSNSYIPKAEDFFNLGIPKPAARTAA
jgi:hypothetical protein